MNCGSLGEKYGECISMISSYIVDSGEATLDIGADMASEIGDSV